LYQVVDILTFQLDCAWTFTAYSNIFSIRFPLLVSYGET
jgi:hypothetical protein